MHPANQPLSQPFPLHAAARAGDLHATDALMTSPCRTLNVNALDRAGATPLLYAIHYGHTGVAARLLAAGADPNRPVSCPPLHAAARAGDARAVGLLVAHGARINTVVPVGDNRTTVSALGWACEASGGLPVVHALLQAGARPDAGRNFLPLHQAAAAGNDAILRGLLRAGADANARTCDGDTALAFAAGRPRLIATLLSFGADPNSADSLGNTPLHAAALDVNPAAVAALLAGGADAARQNSAGLTPLRAMFGEHGPEPRNSAVWDVAAALLAAGDVSWLAEGVGEPHPVLTHGSSS